MRRALAGLLLVSAGCRAQAPTESPRVDPPVVSETAPDPGPVQGPETGSVQRPEPGPESSPESSPEPEPEPEPAPAPPMMPIVGRKAPSFDVEDVEGARHRLKDLRGKVVVLNFWFIECKPCLAELPRLNALADAHRDEGVVFLAPSVNERAPLDAFLLQRRFAYRVIPAAFELATAFEIKAYPSHVVIDREGRISFATGGLQAGTLPALEAEIGRLLAE